MDLLTNPIIHKLMVGSMVMSLVLVVPFLLGLPICIWHAIRHDDEFSVTLCWLVGMMMAAFFGLIYFLGAMFS